MSYVTQCIQCRRNIVAGRSFCKGCASALESLTPTTDSEEANDRHRVWRVKACIPYEQAIALRMFAD